MASLRYDARPRCDGHRNEMIPLRRVTTLAKYQAFLATNDEGKEEPIPSGDVWEGKKIDTSSERRGVLWWFVGA